MSILTQRSGGDARRVSASIAVIKGIHSLIFLSMAGSILYTLYSGLTGRISRKTGAAAAAVIGEGAVLLLNNGRCPLTDAVEDLGADHGSVSDIFLPAAIAERIPVLFTPPFAIGLIAISIRHIRTQPVIAGLSAIVAGLFLVVPWLFWSDFGRPRPRDRSEATSSQEEHT
jgi:hypothetical protein